MSVCLTSFNLSNPLMRTGQSTEEFTPYQIGKTLPLVEGTGNADIDRRLVTYTNSMQMRILNFGSRTTFIRAGRGFGKTSVEGLHTIRIAQTIPFGTSIFMGCSIAQLQKKTMPALIKSIEMLSGGRLKEGVHFFRCRPPKAANFPMPLSKPRTYDSLVYFYTGHVIHLVSMEVSATANGMTLAAIISDETRYQNWKKYQEEIRPALRQELFDHPGWNAENHVNYFLWSKEESVAKAESYSDASAAASDVFFTNEAAETAKADFTVNGVTGEFRTLSAEEWTYILSTRTNAADLLVEDVTVCGVEHCLVIAPDDCLNSYVFDKTKKSYDAADWATAEAAGLVCLPPAGYRDGTEIKSGEGNGFYWASTTDAADKASNLGFKKSDN